MSEEYISSALVDYSGFGKTINDLHGSFSLLEFLDFCAILEGLVLHDQLIVVQGNSLPDRWNDVLKPLFDSGVVIAEDGNAKPIDPGPRIDRRNVPHGMRFPRNGIARSSVEDSWYETGRLLGAERKYDCSPLPLIRQRPFYERYGYVPERHTVCDLFGQYQNLSDALNRIRSQSTVAIAPYVVVPIPPIPLLVFQNSESFGSVLSRALDIRDDYRKLRQSLTGLRENLADDSIAPNKKLRAINSWQKCWVTLNEYKDSASTIEIANNAIGVADIDDAVDGIGLGSLRLDKLLQGMLRISGNALNKWRIRLLHRAARHYLSTADGALNAEVARLFRYNVTPEDFRDLDEWLASPTHERTNENRV